ncbi:ABC transporter permease [Qipengyuania spongiae]|uniref:ABC transporter permease n=1 Tax=Qipengyuania spongiae TaxID=2909673 RepID=A0ABY5T023_9SPHN|nr:ABC transporter permease [Qipengyuania spongiae]UVI39839.1 ABC transporter permease [Qipengyuania spongiae]
MNAERLSIWQAAYVIARRDFFAILLSKAFLFFLLGPLFFGGISVAAGALGAKAASSAEPPRLAVAMSEGNNAAFAETHEKLLRAVELPSIERVSSKEGRNPRALLADGTRNFGAVLTGTLASPELTGTPEQIGRWQGPVALVAAEAAGGKVPQLPAVSLVPTRSSSADTRSLRVGTATAGITLLFLLTMLLAGMVLSNLVEEKANKIIEILAAAIPMDAVFLGKLFAMLAISFVGIAVWGAVAAVVLALGAAALPPLPAPAVGWSLFIALFVVYFSLAYLLIGSVFLTVGSMAATVRDVQTLSMPATILQLAVFFLATFAMTDTGSAIEILACVFPLSSPYAMVARAAQEPQLWTHGLALVWQMAWVAIFVRTGARLFRRRVMKSGPAAVSRKKPKRSPA